MNESIGFAKTWILLLLASMIGLSPGIASDQAAERMASDTPQYLVAKVKCQDSLVGIQFQGSDEWHQTSRRCEKTIFAKTYPSCRYKESGAVANTPCIGTKKDDKGILWQG